MLKICFEDVATTEVVYVCKNTDGFYLSETALKNLKLLPEGWPNGGHPSSSNSTTDQQSHIDAELDSQAEQPSVNKAPYITE